MDRKPGASEIEMLEAIHHRHDWKAVGILTAQQAASTLAPNGSAIITQRAAIAQSCGCGEVRAVWLPDPRDA